MARKRLNKNIVIGLTLFSMAAIVFVAVLMLRQLENRDPQHFVALAQDYEAHEEWQQAAGFYMRAYTRSHDPLHLVFMGHAFLEAGEVQRALSAWEQALIDDPALIEAHRTRLETLLKLSKLYPSPRIWSKIAEAAKTMLDSAAQADDTTKAFVHHAIGMSLMYGQRTIDSETANEGILALEKAVTLAPGDIDYAIDLANAHLRAGDLSAGASHFADLLTKYEDTSVEASKIHTAFARHLNRPRATDETDDNYFARVALAGEHIISAVASAGDDVDAMREAYQQRGIFFAQSWARAKQKKENDEITEPILAKAIAAYEFSIKADDDNFDTYVLLATLYRASQHFDDAINACERRLDAGFSRKGIRAAYDKQFAFQLMILASQTALAKSRAEDAELDQAEKDKLIIRAKQYVDDANGEFPGHPHVLTQSARIKFFTGQDREALEDLRSADAGFLSMDVVDWDSKLLLARLHLKLNEPGAAKDTILDGRNRAKATAPLAMWITYAQALMLNDEIENPALDRALEIVRRNDPTNDQARQIRAALLERRGQFQGASGLVQDEALRSLLMARELISQDDIEQAIQVLITALQNEPAEPRLLAAAVQLLLSREKLEKAQLIVASALKIKPDDNYLKRLSLVVQPELSTSQRKESIASLISEEKDAYERAARMADFHIRNHEPEQAIAYLDEAEKHLIARDTPAAQQTTSAQHRAILLSKLRAGALSKNDSAMTEARDAAAKYNVDGAGGQHLLGLYYMYRDEWSLAKLALRAAVDAQPTHAQSLASLAHCLHRLGDTDEASSYYQRALRVNPNEALARKGLAMLAKDVGDQATYEKHLAACKRLIPSDQWVRNELELQQERADPDKAIANYESSLASDPDNLKTLSRLTELYEANNDLEKADDIYRHLMTLKPDERVLIVAIGKYYRRTNRPQLAEKTLLEFADSRTTPKEKAEALVLLAAHQLSLSQLDDVEQTLLQAAEIAHTFEVCHSLGEFYQRTVRKPAEALTWYDQAIASVDDDTDIKLASVKLARIACLLSRELDDLEGASEGLATFRKQYPNDARADLWESEILSRRGQIIPAVERLTTFLQANPNHTYALFKRAQHTLSLGRLPASLTDLEQIKQADPLALALAPRLLLARLHHQANREDARLRELESLLQDAPQSEVALEALTRAYIELKRFADADRVVTARINQSSNAPNPRWFALRADISGGLNDHGKMLADLQRAAELSKYAPSQVIAVLNAFASVGQATEGVTYFEKHANADTAPALVLGQYGKLLALAGQTNQAVHVFRQAAEKTMSKASLHARTLADLAQRGFGSLESTLKYFTELSDDASLSRANNRILARLYSLAGRVKEADAIIEKLLVSADKNHQRADLFTERGELYLNSKDFEKARKAYEQSLKYDETNWVVLNNLAYLLSDALGENEAALTYAKSAVRYRDVAETLDTLGWIYVLLGRYDEAAAELTRAIRLNPDSYDAYYHLGEAYRRGQRFLEAADIYHAGFNVAESQGDAIAQGKISKSQARAAASDHQP